MGDAAWGPGRLAARKPEEEEGPQRRCRERPGSGLCGLLLFKPPARGPLPRGPENQQCSARADRPIRGPPHGHGADLLLPTQAGL